MLNCCRRCSGGGYDIAWHDPSSHVYGVEAACATDHFLSNCSARPRQQLGPGILRDHFNLDLNGDGHIGLVTHVVQVDGATTLAEVGNNFFLDVTGSTTLGQGLQYRGVAVTAGEFGTYAPIAAVQVPGGGHDIAWHDPEFAACIRCMSTATATTCRT